MELEICAAWGIDSIAVDIVAMGALVCDQLGGEERAEVASRASTMAYRRQSTALCRL
jgi:hypothetical protein